MSISPNPAPLAYPAVEAAKQIGIGRTKLFALIAQGDLKSFTVGSKRLVPAAELERFVRDRMQAGAA